MIAMLHLLGTFVANLFKSRAFVLELAVLATIFGGWFCRYGQR